MVQRISLVALVAGLVIAPIGTPIRAQASGAPAAKVDTSLTPWPARPVGSYELQVATPDHTIPVSLVIADSAQHLVATLRSEEDGETHIVTATVKGTELTLLGETPNGSLTLVLQQRDRKIIGTWTLGDQSGTLTGMAKPAK